MSIEMETIPLGGIVSIKGGKRLPKGQSLQSAYNEHPYIRVRDMGHRYIPAEDLKYVPDEIFPKIHRYVVEENDVIISIVGTIGLVSIIDSQLHLASQTENAAKLTGLDCVDAHYLYYYLNSRIGQAEIQKGTVGAVQPKLPLYNIQKIPVAWPHRDARKVISKQLSLLDDKVQLNHQISQTLEQIAQTIFKSWFVDFDPVKAKIEVLEAGGSEEEASLAAMQVISSKNTEELTAFQTERPETYAELRATAELFPNAMEESELGEIPKGWEVSEIGKEVLAVGGGTPSTKVPEFWENGSINWTTPRDLSNLHEKVLVETDRKITKIGLTKISSGLLPVDTVLMSSRAPVGYLALAKIPTAINQGYVAMRCEKKLTPEYVIQWCAANMSEIKNRASGTTFAEISRRGFRIIPVIVPTEGVLSAYSTKIKTIYEKIELNVRESKSLSELRDTLLPKLLSGELDVSELAETLEVGA